MDILLVLAIVLLYAVTHSVAWAVSKLGDSE